MKRLDVWAPHPLWMSVVLPFVLVLLGTVPSPAFAQSEDAGKSAVRQVDVTPDDDGAVQAPAARTYVPTEASERLIAAGKRVGGVLRAIEQPCLRYVGFRCAERALDAWHAALDRVVDANGGDGPDAHAIVFGNSLIASDRITDIVRARLQEFYGKGGGSFYLLDRLADYGGRWRTGKSDRRWDIYNFSQGSKGAYPFGVPGAHHVSQRAGARTRWRIEGDRVARVFWFDHKRSPGFSLWIDGEKALDVKPVRNDKLSITQLELPPDAKTLTLVAKGARLVVHGAEMDMPAAGVRFDTHGIVAADSRKWMSADLEQFQTELAARNPQLVVVMLGGNEVRRVAWRRYSLKTVEEQASKFLDRLQTILPGSSCLVIGPLHAIEGKDHRRPFQTRPQLAPVNRIYREQALAHGCAFFDTYAAMGGEGSLRRFYKNRMLHADYVHPRADGLNFLGEYIAQGLFRAWEKTPRPLPLSMPPPAVGILAPDARRGDAHPLSAIQREARLLRQLDALEENERSRVAVAVVGSGIGSASAQEIRNAFGRRFGDRGPGMVRGLSRGTVKGQALVTSPVEAAYGIAAGLDGDRVHLEKGAAYSLALPTPQAPICSEGDDRSGPTQHVQILWRNGPRAPRATVSVGRVEAMLDRDEGAALDGGVHVESLQVPLAEHTLEVSSLDDGMLDLLAVAVEADHPGTVVDDLTHQSVQELLRLHPAVAAGQARARNWQLLIFAPKAEDLDAAPPTIGAIASNHRPTSSALLALERLQEGAPAAHCIVVAPMGAGALDPSSDAKARSVADAAGCSYFSVRMAIDDVEAWTQSGDFDAKMGATPQGQERLMTLFLDAIAARLDAKGRRVASRKPSQEEAE